MAALADRYSIEREIGRGGMARVYLAHDVRHDRPVAIKVLSPSVTNAVGAERFLREVRIAAALTHPHILSVHDSGDADGLLYFVMPYVQGESLRARLDREHQLPIEDAVRITREVADALAYAHAQGVVHRDIKPENILLTGGHALVVDFGVARAITTAAGNERRLTDSGFAVGTPAYMSPEQAAGELDIDGRSDLYALGCVCFEMLIGLPPFTGPNAQVVRMRHVAEPPPSIRSTRPTVPREIEAVVHRLMAKVPADRFDTADRLLAMLPATTTERPVIQPPPRRRWPIVAAVAALVALAALVLRARGIDTFTSLGGVEPDSTRYAVVPFLEEGTLPAGLSGASVARDMADALGDWRGIEVVRDFRVRDLLARADRAPTSMRASAALARQLHAGYVIWGDVRATSGGANVRAVIYRSTDHDEVIAERNVFVPAGGAVRDSLATLTAGLLTNRPGSVRRSPGTSDYPAYRAFSRGQEALSEWDLTKAREAFAQAVQLDPTYSEAHLWLALVGTWAAAENEPTGSWQSSARRAAELLDKLPPHDRPYALALAAMADERFGRACALFDSLVGVDSTSFEAWYGLGNCLGNDRAVVTDAGSPSGYAFRSSLERGVTAYMRALELVPSAHRAFRGAAFERLPRDMLFASPNKTRSGRLIRGTDTLRFFAFAALQGDTIAFTPYPPEQLFGGTAGPPHAAIAAAASRNRGRLRRITERWIEAFPSSPDAREAFARALEGLGEIDEARDERRSALIQLRHARRLATDQEQRLRLAEAEVRLLLKTSRFAAAARLADSVLASASTSISDSRTLSSLAALAALRGDATAAAAILSRAAPTFMFTTRSAEDVPLDRPLAEPALAYLAYAAVGAPADTLRARERETREALERFVAPPRREELAFATLLRPSMLAFPIAGPSWIHRQGDQPVPLFTLQRLLMLGDTVALRRQLDRLVQVHAAFRPGDVSIDETHQEAELRLAIGDTAAAVALLDRSLLALPTLGFELVFHVSESAALVRSMELRARLARSAGDPATAQRWTTAVSALRR
jgi:tetratricopeptide (TPR) repeat protein